MRINLDVVGLGMVTAVGQDAVSSSASMRAGLSRATGLADAVVEDPEQMEVLVSGHQISPLTDGFLQTGRWIRLARACLGDLIRQTAPSEDRTFWRRTALLVAVPDATGPRFGWPPDGTAAEIVAEAFVSRLLDLMGLDVAFRPADVLWGHCGAITALGVARERLDRDHFERALVLGVDSYVDALALVALQESGRLKTPDMPVGMIPGEAGACFLLERSAARHDARKRIAVTASHLASDASPREANIGRAPAEVRAAIARRLVEVATTALEHAEMRLPFRGDIVLDLNGEPWRSQIWGLAQPSLLGHIDFEQCHVVLPSLSFGEIGAASTAAAMCVSVRSFIRGYARGAATLILSISENGDTAAAVLGGP